MFKKPFKIKSNTQLKSSDRKKLRYDILRQFPEFPEKAFDEILPNKETVLQLKLITHSNTIVFVYTLQKLPIMFEIEKVLYPTVYTLWHVPDLLHTFTTHPTIFPVLTQGADLMLPGVVLPHGPSVHAFGKLEKGDRVAVNLTTNKAPVAVGTAANSSYDLYMSGNRGKCVQILHFYGDLLSLYGTKLVLPELGPAFESEADKPTDPSTSLEDTAKASSQPETIDEEVDMKNLNIETADVETPDEKSGTESMNDLMMYCFLKALKTTMKKVELPLLTSNFYKVHMIPASPEGKTVDVKKSKYKKLSKFLDEMAKLGVITVESLQKGVETVTKIDYNCDLLKQFVDNESSQDASEKGILVDTTPTSKSSVPEITEKFTVTANVLPLFYLYDYKKKDALTPAVVRKVIGDYVRVKNLQNPDNKKEVVLDDVLKSATNVTDEKTLTWEQLTLNVFKQMGHAYKVEVAGNEQPLNKGKLAPIDIQVGSRSGNKKVTLVSNLELYGINLAEFSRECQHGVAASTTVNHLPSAKSAQLQIQGNQVTYVANLLTEKYHIPKQYLRGLENAPKKKK